MALSLKKANNATLNAFSTRNVLDVGSTDKWETSNNHSVPNWILSSASCKLLSNTKPVNLFNLLSPLLLLINPALVKLFPTPVKLFQPPIKLFPTPVKLFPPPVNPIPLKQLHLPDDHFPSKMFAFSALPARLLTIDEQPLMTPILKVYEL